MRWRLFFRALQQDLKLYIFMCFFFSLMRALFIYLYRSDLPNDYSWSELIAAMYQGFRISLKSAGIITALTFFIVTIPFSILKKEGKRLRLYLAGTYIVLLSFLFQARLVYYNEFHSVFNQFIFNALYEDQNAILWTIMQQYQIFTRLAAGLLMTVLACWSLRKLLAAGTFAWPHSLVKGQVLWKLVIIVFIPLFMIFNRFGGSFSYAHSIHWENSAMSRIDLLNEAILDDVQALYRAYNTYLLLQDGTQLKLSEDKMPQYAAVIAGRQGSFTSVEEALRRTAQGARLEKPKHIYVILAESYAAWPLEEKYASLHLADGMKKTIEKPDAIHIKSFLPNADGSIQAVSGLVTGLAEVNLHVNYKAATYQKPFETALAPQLKRLGYKTYFWYGGFSSWERVKEFSLAQGFDRFYGAADLQAEAGNAWGVNDKEFFREILQGSLQDEMSLHLIFTTSNHPPFTVNLESEGFERLRMQDAMPEKQRDDQERLKQNGHFWYADKVMAEFIAAVREKDPDSLFVVMGDHSTRFIAEPNASLWERTAVPLFIIGKGVSKEMIPENAAGSHISVIPTLIELIAPKGFTYYSLLPGMMQGSEVGVSRDYWITAEGIGANYPVENNGLREWEKVQAKVEAVQAMSWWRIMKGGALLPQENK